MLTSAPRLPGFTDRLVSEVIAANANTIVVNQSGTPVEMPWIDEAHTVLQVSNDSGESHAKRRAHVYPGILRRKRGGQRHS